MGRINPNDYVRHVDDRVGKVLTMVHSTAPVVVDWLDGSGRTNEAEDDVAVISHAEYTAERRRLGQLG